MSEAPAPPETLRAEQVAQTRRALIESGRRLFGAKGFAGTSVEDLAREARVTTGALYHHFPNKTALFETVFETVHGEVLEACVDAGTDAPNAVEFIARALEAFLDAVLDPQVQRIVVTDAPAVLGQERFTELDERYSFGPMVAGLEMAQTKGELVVDDAETLARLLFGALSRGATLIAASPDPAETRDRVARGMRALLAGLAP